MGASSLPLYQLKAVITAMLSDPRRALAARTSLHPSCRTRSERSTACGWASGCVLLRLATLAAALLTLQAVFAP